MITIRGIHKKYRMGEGIIAALDSVNLDIGEGEFVSVTGASGSGKTTLMNILGCLDSPSEGSYILDGEDVSRMSRRRLARVRNLKIGFIFQGFNLIPTLTARENVLLPLIYRKTPAKTRERLADEALEIVGLSKRANHRPSQLSGGQQQRVAIARAIAAKPPLILADEPCGSLDSRTSADIMKILRGLNETGRTVVLITHDEKAARSADKIIRISDGRIV
ncbi:MAG: ABC transporter ATP-binding protein [Oscillospiraceae bacterium]|jgi:putative ABC transport system ATP-binding protein|nr:ABC transporter ATP-binding protein [Oscillospiraceae bacterium]